MTNIKNIFYHKIQKRNHLYEKQGQFRFPKNHPTKNRGCPLNNGPFAPILKSGLTMTMLGNVTLELHICTRTKNQTNPRRLIVQPRFLKQKIKTNEATPFSGFQVSNDEHLNVHQICNKVFVSILFKAFQNETNVSIEPFKIKIDIFCRQKIIVTL